MKSRLGIYWPATCDLLTVGHIKCLEWLTKRGFVTVGLLTDEALKGYKKNVVPFPERKYILETVAIALGNIDVVPQETLDPGPNIKKYQCDAIASGDGWLPAELTAAKCYNLTKIVIKLKGEKTKRYSSSQIKQKIWKQKKSS